MDPSNNTLSDVKAILRYKYPKLNIKGNDRVIIITDEELSAAVINNIYKESSPFATVFMTTAGYNYILNRGKPEAEEIVQTTQEEELKSTTETNQQL